MGRLVVIEGLDGAGKRTLTDTLADALTGQGATVARMAFPRYGADVHADLAREALYGRMGDLGSSVYGMAVLFALDRRDAVAALRGLREDHDVVLLDRYVASNAAYGAARLRQDAGGGFVRWIRDLEIERFGVPVPDTQLLLRVPSAVAATRAHARLGGVDAHGGGGAETGAGTGAETGRGLDAFEADDGLQARCAAVYDGLAAMGWLTRWRVLDGTGTREVCSELAVRLLAE